MRAGAALLAAAALLAGCKQEQRDLTVAQQGGQVIIQGDASDCITRLSVERAEADRARTVLWSLEHPMPMANDGTCRLRFPVVYGRVPEAISAWPDTAPPVEQGGRYVVHAEGMSYVHSGEFIAR